MTLRGLENDVSDRERYLQRTYGISEQQYEDLLHEQGGVCAICRKSPGRVRLAVDHHHASGLIRGLLCGHLCNYRLLGRGLDSAKLHEAAFWYLTDPPAQRILPGATVPKKEKK